MDILYRYLREVYDCSCGQKHNVPIQHVIVEETMVEDLLCFLSDTGFKRVLIIADTNTFRVCGKDVYEAVSKCNFDTNVYVFPPTHDLLPDEMAIETIREHIQSTRSETVIAVGSGVINDIVRFATYQELLPYIVVGTAPSMDGYASTVAALQFKGVKTTIPSHAPVGIFANPNILSDAPWELIQSGFGDLVGKIISLLDWKLSNALYQEYLCKESYQVVWEPLQYCFEHAEQIRKRNPESIRNLFIGLINSGIAMAMMGNSRPASGSEHHCSHYWDFLAFIHSRRHYSHGLQVGYATHWMMDFYSKLQKMKWIQEPLPLIQDEDWEASICARYGDGVNTVLTEQRNKKHWIEETNKQMIISKIDFETLLSKLEPELSCINQVRYALETVGITHMIGYLDISSSMLEHTYLHANELRARYTILDFLQGQGLLQNFAKEIVNRL